MRCLPRAVPVLTLLFVLQGTQVASTTPTWPVSVQIPKIKIREVVKLGKADISDDEPKITESKCGLACLSEEMREVVAGNRLHELYSFETMYKDGRVELTVVDVDKSGIVDVDAETFTKEKTRDRREIFGIDTRFAVTEEYLRQPPFSTVVKLSTGCSGTLIGKRSVLTAAECVHNGKGYIRGARKLKVGIRKADVSETVGARAEEEQFHWIPAEEIKIPQGWKKMAGRDLDTEHNYAVIRLQNKVGESDTMNFGAVMSASLNSDMRIHFASYDNPDTSELMYRFCPIVDKNEDVIYQYCDSEESSVGAGIYVRLWDSEARQWARKVVGVFNGHKWIEDSDYGYPIDYNVAVIITPLKYAQICLWLGEDDENCGDIQYTK